MWQLYVQHFFRRSSFLYLNRIGGCGEDGYGVREQEGCERKYDRVQRDSHHSLLSTSSFHHNFRMPAKAIVNTRPARSR